MRASGILLPVSSIPSAYGIGSFSKEAYEFVDFLEKAGQSYWQILPLGPTGYGDSPYQSFSTFAGNPYYIDFEELIEGFLEINELPYMDCFEVPCTFHPQYEYHQLSCIVYSDGRGFHADYDLTTDGELNDLTLNMDFLFTESGAFAVKILDAHVM